MPPIEFSVDTNKRLITWRSVGRITPQEVNKMHREVEMQARAHDGWNALLDVRAQENALPVEHLHQFVEALPTFPYPLRWAVVTGRPLTLGMANLFSVLVEEKNVWVRLFERIEDAEAWLAESDDPNSL